MVDRGNINKHRTTYSGGVKAVETEKWGRDTARERYGALKYENKGAPSPEIRNKPQHPENRQDLPRYDNIVDPNSWLRGGGSKQAEGKPNFHPGYKGKK